MIKKELLLTLAILLLISISGCISHGIKPISRKFDTSGFLFGGKQKRGLVVGIKKNFISPTSIDVFLKNENKHPLTVYGAFRVDRDQYDESSDIFITIVDKKTGMEVPLKSQKSSTIVSFDGNDYRNYYTLAPSEYIETTINLLDYYPLQEDSNYIVSVEYDHQETGFEKDDQWIEMNAWTGRCISNRLRVTM